jgi:hypothetical protein
MIRIQACEISKGHTDGYQITSLKSQAGSEISVAERSATSTWPSKNISKLVIALITTTYSFQSLLMSSSQFHGQAKTGKIGP